MVIPHVYHGKDKTFFFMSYEGLQLPRQSFITDSVPSLALRSGDLFVYNPKVILDPSSGVPFAGDQIPMTRISPIALNVLKYLMPLPNTGPANAIANNFTVNFPTPISSNQADLRIDQNINSKQTMFFRGTYKVRDVSNVPSATGTILAGATVQPETDYSFTLAHNYVITPTIVNELHSAAARRR